MLTDSSQCDKLPHTSGKHGGTGRGEALRGVGHNDKPWFPSLQVFQAGKSNVSKDVLYLIHIFACVRSIVIVGIMFFKSPLGCMFSAFSM